MNYVLITINFDELSSDAEQALQSLAYGNNAQGFSVTRHYGPVTVEPPAVISPPPPYVLDPREDSSCAP